MELVSPQHRERDSPQFIKTVNLIKIVVSVAITDGIAKILDLRTGNASPNEDIVLS